MSDFAARQTMTDVNRNSDFTELSTNSVNDGLEVQVRVEPPQLVQCRSVRFSFGVLYTCRSELKLLVQLSLNHGIKGGTLADAPPHTRRNYTRDLFALIFIFATSGTTRVPVVPWPNLLQMESYFFCQCRPTSGMKSRWSTLKIRKHHHGSGHTLRMILSWSPVIYDRTPHVLWRY